MSKALLLRKGAKSRSSLSTSLLLLFAKNNVDGKFRSRVGVLAPFAVAADVIFSS